MFKGNKYKIHISILICLARPGKYSFYMEDKKKMEIYIYILYITGHYFEKSLLQIRLYLNILMYMLQLLYLYSLSLLKSAHLKIACNLDFADLLNLGDKDNEDFLILESIANSRMFVTMVLNSCDVSSSF